MTPTINLQWQRIIGTALLDRLVSLQVLSDGSVVVAGHTNADPLSAAPGDLECFIALFSPEGALRWSETFGTANDDQLKALALSADGGIVAVGSTWGTFLGQTNYGGVDSFVVKFDANGKLLWVRQFGSTQEDITSGVSVATDGTIWVAGQTRGGLGGQHNAGGSDGFVVALSSAGDIQRTALLGTNAEDNVTAIISTIDGSILVAGGTWQSLQGRAYNGGGDAYVAKLSTHGEIQWTRLFGSGAFDTATSLGIASDGAIYVAGITTGTLEGQTISGGQDMFVMRLTPEGERQWLRQLGSKATDAVTSLVVLSDNSVMLGGYTLGQLDNPWSYGGSDLALVSYNSLGALQWTYQFGSTADDTLFALGRLGATGLYVAGETAGSLGRDQPLGQTDGFVSRFDLPFKTPTITLKAQQAQANEGTSIRFDIQTTNMSVGSTLEYKILGVTSEDIGGAALGGTVTIDALGQAFIVLYLAADQLAEGTESLSVVLAEHIQTVSIIDSSVGFVPKSFGIRFEGASYRLVDWLDPSAHPDGSLATVVRYETGWDESFRKNAAALLSWHQQNPLGNQSLRGLSIFDALTAIERGLQSEQQLSFIELTALIADCEVLNGELKFDRNFLTSSASPTDRIAPTLVSISPPANATVGLEPLQWTLSFSEPIALGSVKASIVSNHPGLVVQMSTNASTLKASVEGFVYASSYYRLVIPEGVVLDLSGNRFAGGVFEVSTVGTPPPSFDPPPST